MAVSDRPNGAAGVRAGSAACAVTMSLILRTLPGQAARVQGGRACRAIIGGISPGPTRRRELGGTHAVCVYPFIGRHCRDVTPRKQIVAERDIHRTSVPL